MRAGPAGTFSSPGGGADRHAMPPGTHHCPGFKGPDLGNFLEHSLECRRASTGQRHTEGDRMQPTSELEKEHENIRRMLEVVREMIRRLEAGDLQAAIDFIREYADRSHHAKEEDLLFLGHGRSRLPPGG